MRTPNLRVSALALAAVPLLAACGGTALSSPDTAREPAPPAHHLWTPEPAPPYEPEPTWPPPTPYADVTFEDPGVNAFVPTERDRESTFGLDVDTASYTIARRFVADGNLPDPASVRVEEFVNAMPHDYPAPRDGTFALYADGGPTPFLGRDEVLLRLGVKAREVGEGDRPQASLTFVIDTSGSMAREDRLELVKQSLTLLVDRLDHADTVAIVTYGSDARVVLEPTSVRDAERILGAIHGLATDGSTNAEAGLALGYELAAHTFREVGINRVVLASDGVANTGQTDADAILRRIRWDASLGIQLVTVGFGMGNYNDALMEQLADRGDGFYAYVDTLDDARTLFAEQLGSTLQSVALDARAQVEFDPSLVASYRLVGYENRDLPDEAFRDDRVDAGAIGAGHAVTALYALRLTGEGGRFDDQLGTLRLRWTNPETREADEIALDIRPADLSTRFEEASASFRLDALVAAAAEVFRGSRWADAYSLRDVAEVAFEEERDLPHASEVEDFLRLLDEAARIER
jgi:Ca-activated chloride channel family protein